METQARLIVDIARLDPEGEIIKGELSQEVLELAETEQVVPAGPVRYRLFAQLAGSELLVRGKLELPCRSICSRCAKEVEITYAEPDYVESFDISALSETLDLTDSVRECIILALPTYPVCGEACRGLCLRCGADLNESACTCVRESGSACWSELDNVLLRSEQPE